jgi:hypothetical protein
MRSVKCKKEFKKISAKKQNRSEGFRRPVLFSKIDKKTPVNCVYQRRKGENSVFSE